MKYVWWAIGLLAAGVLAREGYLALVVRRRRQAELFQMAKARAAETGKPLVVIGDPDAGLLVRVLGRTYECGSTCIDTFGCPACNQQIAGNLEEILPSLVTNSAVVFVGHGFERVRDPALVAQHLDRISGGDLFIAHLESASLAAWFTPGHRQRVFFAPPRAPELVYKPLPWSAEPRREGLHVVELPAVRRRLLGDAGAPPAATNGLVGWDSRFGGFVIDVPPEP